MNANKLQTIVNVMYNEITEMNKHDGVFIKLYDTTKEEALEATNAFNDAFPKFRDYRYHYFNTNKGYCILRVHLPGHEERYNIDLMEKFTYLSLQDALSDFRNIVYDDGYTNQDGVEVKGEIDENDDLDGGDFIGQYVGIFKNEPFYYIAGITKESKEEEDIVYPITRLDGKYVCDKNISIEQFKEKPLSNKKLKYDRDYDYKYNRSGFIIEEYIHKFNRTHYTQIVKYEGVDISD